MPNPTAEQQALVDLKQQHRLLKGKYDDLRDRYLALKAAQGRADDDALVSRVAKLTRALCDAPYAEFGASLLGQITRLCASEDVGRLLRAGQPAEHTEQFASALRDWQNRLILGDVAQAGAIRAVYAAELFPELAAVEVPLGAIQEASSHTNQTDLLFVCGIAKLLGARKIFEFGTYQGQTTCCLAGIADDAEVVTLNLPPEQAGSYGPYIGKLIEGSPHRSRITQLYGDSRELDTAPFAGAMDYVFIDADHSYECVANDTRKALEMLRPGGAIAWHDFAAKSPGVCGFIRDFSRERPVFWLRNTCVVLYIDGVDVLGHPLAELPGKRMDNLRARIAAGRRAEEPAG